MDAFSIPHTGQKRASASSAAPHLKHCLLAGADTGAGVPQVGQNFPSYIVPHALQRFICLIFLWIVYNILTNNGWYVKDPAV